MPENTGKWMLWHSPLQRTNQHAGERKYWVSTVRMVCMKLKKKWPVAHKLYICNKKKRYINAELPAGLFWVKQALQLRCCWLKKQRSQTADWRHSDSSEWQPVRHHHKIYPYCTKSLFKKFDYKWYIKITWVKGKLHACHKEKKRKEKLPAH